HTETYRLSLHDALPILRRMKEIRQYGQEDALETGYDEAVERFAAGEAYFFPQGSWCYQALIQENPDLQVQLIPFPVSEEEEQKRSEEHTSELQSRFDLV